MTTIEIRIPLRRNFVASIWLPKDYTESEIERLKKYLELLPCVDDPEFAVVADGHHNCDDGGSDG